MSVLIKGMEMPKMPETLKQAEKIPYIDVRIFADGTAVISKGEKPYYTEYSVIEVPSHGRLIDADKIVSYMDIEYDFDGDWRLVEDFDDIPTVIEAEGTE